MSTAPQLPDWADDDIDPRVPSIARIYDHLLGGSHNFAVDRDWADDLERRWPGITQATWANRAFLRRVIRYCVEAGITQFLDIGSGIPTAGNIHEILTEQSVNGQVVYVDNDPVAFLMGRRILADIPWATAIRGDFRDLDTLVRSPEVAQHIDFTEPVAVLVLSILHVVGDEMDPHGVLGRLRDGLIPGSLLAISHFTNEGWSAERLDELLELTRSTTTPGRPRSAAEITALFDGFELVEPGVVQVPLWRPDSDMRQETRYLDWLGGVGIKR